MLAEFFRFQENKTTFKRETIAGFTTFITMAYIVIVNPAILAAAGMPIEASMAATIFTAFIGSLVMGVYANKPIAIAPYMGENAFMAFTVVKVLGFTWQEALGAVFLGGILFVFVTLLKVRGWVANAIPVQLRASFAVGIGLFLTFIGLNEIGLVVLGVPGAPVKVGNLADPGVALGILVFILSGALLMRKVPGALLIGIIAGSAASLIFGLTPLPHAWVSNVPDISPVFLQADISAAFSLRLLPVVLIVFVMGFVDTIGTLYALATRAEMLDKNGMLPDIEKPLLADAFTTVSAALLGTTTAGAYVESATGIESGGRTGFTAVVTGFLFLGALFFHHYFQSIPGFAYGPSLVIVGLLMMQSITQLDFNDLSETLPAFVTMILMSFTFNIGIGMTAGFVLYPVFKALNGDIRDVHPGMWVLGILSLLFYLLYPY